MKQLFAILLFGILILNAGGCALPTTNQAKDSPESPEESTDQEPDAGFWHQTFGRSSGIDPRAREIEKSLGM